MQEPVSLGLFLAVGITISLATGWRLVRQASRISPLEASRRVAGSTRSPELCVSVCFSSLRF